MVFLKGDNKIYILKVDMDSELDDLLFIGNEAVGVY